MTGSFPLRKEVRSMAIVPITTVLEELRSLSGELRDSL